MKKANMTYMDSVHHYGRVWNLSMMVLLLMFPAAVSIIFHAPADGKGLLMGLIATAPMYWAVGFIETLTYVPRLGAGGSYLSFVTGNISNLKLPCALNALEQADVKANSEEGEIVSTVAIAVSSIVTTVIIILGVILIIPLTPVLESPALAPAFAQILPALFGGLGVVFISKNAKLSIAPICLMLVLFISNPAPAALCGRAACCLPWGWPASCIKRGSCDPIKYCKEVFCHDRSVYHIGRSRPAAGCGAAVHRGVPPQGRSFQDLCPRRI